VRSPYVLSAPHFGGPCLGLTVGFNACWEQEQSDSSSVLAVAALAMLGASQVVWWRAQDDALLPALADGRTCAIR